jgi:hypothetical protein
VTDEGHGLAGLVDLTGDPKQLLTPPHDVGGVTSRYYQPVEIVRADLVDAGVDRDGISFLTLIGLVAGPRHHGPDALLLQPDLGIPELEVLVERPRKEENGLSLKTHDCPGV